MSHFRDRVERLKKDMAKTPKTAFEPELIITVTPRGVTRIGIPYSNLAEERAGRALQERCATLISLLS